MILPLAEPDVVTVIPLTVTVCVVESLVEAAVGLLDWELEVPMLSVTPSPFQSAATAAAPDVGGLYTFVDAPEVIPYTTAGAIVLLLLVRPAASFRLFSLRLLLEPE